MTAIAVRKEFDLETVRSSSAPKAMKCPGSLRTPEVVVDYEHAASGMGSAVHAAWAQFVAGIEIPDLKEIARRFGIADDQADELEFLTRFARKCWLDVRNEFPSPEPEVELAAELCEGVTLTGHIDTLSVIRRQRRFHLADLKTGRVDANYEDQLMAYAYLVFTNDPEMDDGDACVVWLRDSEIERYRVTRDDAYAWRDKFVERVIKWDGAFHPGEHCGHCPRLDCPAMLAMTKQAIEIFGSQEMQGEIANGLAGLTGPQIFALRRQAKVIEKVIGTFDDVVRTVVRQRGEIESGDGQVMLFKETEGRRIDPLAAWPVFEKVFSDEDIAKNIKVSISNLETLIAKAAGKGKGAGAVRDFNQQLDAVGAVTRTTSERLSTIRRK